MRLNGKVAIVTGAAAGIGAEVVRLYREAGARVVAVDIDPRLPVVLGSEGADDLRCVVGDVAREETADLYVKAALDAFGRIDVMVNNAGISVVKPIHEHAPEEWDRVFAVNVRSIFLSARAVVPVMIAQGGGLILNTGSISSVVGIAGQGAYGPSKGAVAQITRQMAVEYAARGIRVNAVCPGTVDTPMLRQAAAATGDPAAFQNGLKASHPVGRIATAEEIARVFLYLATDDATFVTGALLMIDGGFTAQ